jgi:dihydropteroate synthase
MGILNLTPDSFSDGDSYPTLDAALAAAEAMVAAGADIIDVGGESTRPASLPVPLDEELRRVLPVIGRLAGQIGVPVSVDTWKAEVARRALAAGAEIVNDISAMTFDPAMAGVVAATEAGLVLMHTRGRPNDMQRDTSYPDLLATVGSALQAALQSAASVGIAPERIVVDPGLGFGKSCEGNLHLLRNLGELAQLGRPILIGPSRKSFIGSVLGRGVDDRVFGTAAAVAVGLVKGARIFRVHDVRAMRDVVDMADAIVNP